MRKRYVFISLFVLMIISAFLTNPTLEDYMQISTIGDYMQSTNEQGHHLVAEGKIGNTIVKIERVNFYIFSTYTPFFYVEPGTTHLGVFGHFIRISDGQFDYPRWLELFDQIRFVMISYNSVYSKWSYEFAVYNKNVYVVTDKKVNAELIGSMLGQVIKYSDQEAIYSGNFSNKYPKGTKYYVIIGSDYIVL